MNNELLINEIKCYGLDPDFVFAHPEKDRIIREVEIFHERGWQKYILFLSDLIKRINETCPACVLSGSVLCSYLLKMLSDNKFVKDNDILNNDALRKLENEALRMELKAVGLSVTLPDSLKEIDNALQSTLEEHRLKLKQMLLKNKSEVIVISCNNIPQEHMDIKEKKKNGNTEEEERILKEYLILTVKVDISI